MNQNVFGRLASVDILRGLVMIVMALDHTRDYFTNWAPDPLDFSESGPAMFLTRWITHFCAPVFVFLAGTSVFLSLRKGRTKKQCAAFLLKRGIWLILLELTLLKIGWEFNFEWHVYMLGVIWAIGCSMISLAALLFLPLPWIAFISLLMIFGHNALDGMQFSTPAAQTIWHLLHQPGDAQLGPFTLFILYPVIPWIGVMSLGYCFGKLMVRERSFRDFWCYIIGTTAIVLFVILRWSNLYGDTHDWQVQSTWWQTLFDFVRCEKYPPSLLYLLMTLGPAILLLPVLDRIPARLAYPILVYGRVWDPLESTCRHASLSIL